jgi:hypothetical protein
MVVTGTVTEGQSYQKTGIAKYILGEQDLETLQKFLAQEEEIRIFVPDVCNFGHQGTTINIMYRLIELGARQIRIIYADGSEEAAQSDGEENLETVVEVWPKLQLLISELPDEPVTEFAIGQTKVYLNSADQWMNERAGEVNVVITGGWDIAEESRHVALGAWKDFKARNFLILQPLKWWSAPNLVGLAGKETLIDLADAEELGAEFGDSVYYVSRLRPSPAEEDWFWTRDPQRYSCVKALLSRCSAATPSIQMCPVYFSPGWTHAAGYDILFNLVAGIMQRNKKLAPQQKTPTVIAVMAPLTTKVDYWESLQVLLNWRDEDSKMRYPQRYQYLEQEGLFEAFQKVRLVRPCEFTEETSGRVLAEVGQDGVVVLALERVPNIIYNWLYASANLPGIFEGHGTASMILNLGKPYWRLRSAYEVDPDLYPLPAPEGIEGLTPEDFSAYCNWCSNLLEANVEEWEQRLQDGKESPAQALATFISRAADEDDALCKAFRVQKEVYHSPLRDKLVQALVHVLRRMEGSSVA